MRTLGWRLNLARYKDALEAAQDELRNKDFEMQSLKAGLAAGSRHENGMDDSAAVNRLVELAADNEQPTPLDCMAIVEQIYGDRCTVLDSAQHSAKKMTGFIYGGDLLNLLVRLVTTYRDALMEGGDSNARNVFGKSEYAATESETVKKNKEMRRQRTFEYQGDRVEMFRHLKIGIDDDPTRTIRVHFHWDGDRKRVVIGYCGEHLSVSSH